MFKFKKKHLQNDEFVMTFKKAVHKYGLYTAEQRSDYESDMKELMRHGLIECIDAKKGIYKFSNRWQTWQPETPINENLAVTNS